MSVTLSLLPQDARAFVLDLECLCTLGESLLRHLDGSPQATEME